MYAELYTDVPCTRYMIRYNINTGKIYEVCAEDIFALMFMMLSYVEKKQCTPGTAAVRLPLTSRLAGVRVYVPVYLLLSLGRNIGLM